MDLTTPILFAATADADRSRHFYEKILRLEFIADEPYALVFRSGDTQLRIQKVYRKPGIPHTVLGWAVADIRKTVRELAAAGVEFIRYPGLEQDPDALWRSPSGAQVAWFRDPDENTLSLTEQGTYGAGKSG